MLVSKVLAFGSTWKLSVSKHFFSSTISSELNSPLGGLQSKIPKKSALEEPYYALDHLTRRHPHFWKASCMGAVTRKSFPTWTHIITCLFKIILKGLRCEQTSLQKLLNATQCDSAHFTKHVNCILKLGHLNIGI